MSESIAQADVRTLRAPEAGVLMALVTSSSRLVERATAGGFDVARTARGELFRTAGASIDWVEAMHHSAFRIVRESLQRLDALSRETVDGVESVTSAVLCTVRGSSEAVGDLASSAAESLVGKRAPAKAA